MRTLSEKNAKALRSREKAMSEALASLKILSHPLRLSILCTLVETKEMMAGDIVAAESHRASQSQISQYLSQMKEQGLLADRRDGHNIYYRLKDERITVIISTLHDLYCR